MSLAQWFMTRGFLAAGQGGLVSASRPAGQPHSLSQLRRAARHALVIALAWPAVSGAQVVRGVVVDEASGRPIPGAVVVLLDSTGNRLAAVLAGDDGRYAVRTTRPGRYGIRAERIGFRATSPTPITLRVSETIEQRLITSPVPVTLSTVRVTGETACVARASDGRDVSTVWDEARKALYATDLTQRQELFSARVVRYVRLLDARTRRVTSHETKEAQGVTRNPFVSAPAGQLSADGFVRQVGVETIYYAPDAGVLLSDEFLNDHCFRLRAGTGQRAGLIGLAFEPVRGRDKPDIVGTLWIDRNSAELRDLEFSYRNIPNLPGTVSSEDFGGQVEFHRMPTGAWIVPRWVIRMPVLADRGRFAEPSSPMPGVRSSRDERVQVAAIREEGGEVLETTARGARRELATERAEVRGAVFDSTRMAPLADARVFLDGTQFSSRTSAAGEFTLEGIPPGRYTISVTHPRFDSLGIQPPGQAIALEAGTPSAVQLAGPSAATLVARSCAGTEHAAGMVAVQGHVRDAGTGGSVGDAAITVTWSRMVTAGARVGAAQERRSTRADASGRYVLCGLPERVALAVRAAHESRYSVPVSLTLPADTLAILDLMIGGPVVVASSDTPEPRAAPPARAEATAVNEAMAQAERRRQRGGGSYLMRSQIERRRASRLSDLLRSIPGIRIQPDENGELMVEFRGATRVGISRESPTPAVTAKTCPAMFQVDGTAFARMNIDGDIQPDDIELIEAYSSALVPIEYAGPTSACGLILIWTRAFAQAPDAGRPRDGAR
ncbi:MAG TPA: carboxypeptidase-like regulatory domain-containing protein [Gemmatimonadaceae bacterium]|nr:carboxypeptidase-like regulatory domain-containing protein [Gemmatimonadaceae bacterium]